MRALAAALAIALSLLAAPMARAAAVASVGSVATADSANKAGEGSGQRSVDAFVDVELPASGAPGLSYAVVSGGRITTLRARGLRRAGGDRPVTPDTPFVTGSITKSVTALAVMQHVEAGQVGLDDPIARHLESFVGRPAAAVTVRQLLSHTSGYSTLQGNTAAVDAGGPDDQLSLLADEAARTAPAQEAGAAWAYSNLNYVILGRLVEVVSGQDYQTYVTTRILRPLGMTHSFVGDGRIHEEVATGHRPWFGTKRAMDETRIPRATAPQGGLVASAGDLARYLQMMVNGVDDILSAAGKAAMLRPASAAAPFYGLGWFVDTTAETAWHSGSTPGFESLATLVPATRSAAVVLVNAGSGIGFGETAQLRHGITARALGLPHPGEGGRWAQRALFVALSMMPIAFLLSIAWAWRHRAAIRAKSGPAGRFSLWFPLITTLALAVIIGWLIPVQFDLSLGTLARFYPDLALVLGASAVIGVSWASFRLLIAHTGTPRRS